MYREINPHPLLAAYVDAYWVAAVTQHSRQRILPDTCADIIFNISRDVIAVADGEQIAPHTAFVVGTMTAFQDSEMPANTAMLGIRFRAGGLNAFTGLPLQLITDGHLSLKETAADWHTTLEPLLAKEISVRGKIHCIENFLLQRLPAAHNNFRKIQHSISLIQQAQGKIPVAALAAGAYMSTRNFERHFLQSVGVSPKTFTRIVRFLEIRRQLKTESHTHLLSLALDNGFYDHAHLTREFKAFSGESPSGYQQR
ncbi:AraC family transcriptional regulator [Chitinophaga sp. 22321]|uniref:AraC family transcriptional regulator n=1 Tax=Chitinophaga hostae TaxID=2831022 RepID=A0ABS5IS30_9BACT|nr:helix-turn-helix domain-containing protein [Chitinophaga hostae]MBS0025758.1 AraC family transcriptional regulator [Chitinophaga hostae]